MLSAARTVDPERESSLAVREEGALRPQTWGNRKDCAPSHAVLCCAALRHAVL